jgi:hypothetical protein
MNGSETFLQLLNDTSPSLLVSIASAEGHGLSDACNVAMDKLKRNGLSNIDSAIVMKSFMDEAKGGSSWYSNPTVVKSCFSQSPNVQTALEQIYGPSAPKFIIGDVQDGVGKFYRDWKEAAGPELAKFKSALLSKSNRKQYLLNFNNRHDIALTFASDTRAWLPDAPDGNGVETYPGIARLAGKEFRDMGCYIFKDTDNLDASHPGAYFVMEGTDGDYWLGDAKLAVSPEHGITSLVVGTLSADWAQHFSSYSYPGGDCSEMLARYRQHIRTALEEENAKQATIVAKPSGELSH